MQRSPGSNDLKIRSLTATPLSYALPKTRVVRHGIGAAVKRDTVIVKVETECGVVGYGESHHARSPTAIAELVNTTLRHLVVGQSAMDIVDVWRSVFDKQMASHGTGAAAYIALSGVDQALWDAKGKYLGQPVAHLLGGGCKPLLAYAGGVSLGFQPVESLKEEVAGLVARHFKVIKMRFGEGLKADLERLAAVRDAFPDLRILVDCNSNYTFDDARKAIPALEAAQVEWLEEPVTASDHRSYRRLKELTSVPLAAGENHYGRAEFARVIEDGAIQVLQPDLSKCGGITEVLRIAHLASAWRLALHPHTSASGLNQAATLHLLSAIDNPGLYEADAAVDNPFRDVICTPTAQVAADGTVTCSDRPGLGIEVDEQAMARFAAIPGPGFV